jgi:DNA-binding protein H-NS
MRGSGKTEAAEKREDAMEIDLNALSLRELKDLQGRVARAIATFEERQRKAALAEVEELARVRGFTLAELTGIAPSRRRKASRVPATAAYVNPDNPAETWGGRGRRPAWFARALAAGRDPESLRA